MNPTHSCLVEAAAVWLRKHCSVVLTELRTTGEEADAIGWQGTHSTLIECKVSRTDFMADRSKFFRRNPEQGLGQSRYYLCPSALLSVDELPTRWGLLEFDGRKTRLVKKSENFLETNTCQEIGLLLSTLRRVGHNAPKTVSIRCYTIQTQNTSSLGLQPPDSPL